jgi:hypothetical protein
MAAGSDVPALALPMEAAVALPQRALRRAADAFGGARELTLFRGGGWCDPLRARLELQPLVQARAAAVDLSALAAAFESGGAVGGGGRGGDKRSSGDGSVSTTTITPTTTCSSGSGSGSRHTRTTASNTQRDSNSSSTMPPNNTNQQQQHHQARPRVRRLRVVDAAFTRHPWPLAEVSRRFPALETLEVCWLAALWAPGQLLHEWNALRGLFAPVLVQLDAARGGGGGGGGGITGTSVAAAAAAQRLLKKALLPSSRSSLPAATNTSTTTTPAQPIVRPPLPRLRSLMLRKAAAAHLGHPPLGDGAVAMVAAAPGPLPTGLVRLRLEHVSLGDAGVRCLALMPGLEALTLRGRLGGSLLALRDGLAGLTRLTSLDLGQLSPPEKEVRELAAAVAAAMAAEGEAAAAAAMAAAGGATTTAAGAALAAARAAAAAAAAAITSPAGPPDLPRPERSPLLGNTPRSSGSGGGGREDTDGGGGASLGTPSPSAPATPAAAGAAAGPSISAAAAKTTTTAGPGPGGTVLRFHSAFGRSGAMSGAPSRALRGAPATNNAAAGAGAAAPPPASTAVVAALGADWTSLFAPLVRLRRLSLHTDLALLGGMETLRGATGGGDQQLPSPQLLPELTDVRLHAGARFAPGEQRSEARRRRQILRQRQRELALDPAALSLALRVGGGGAGGGALPPAAPEAAAAPPPSCWLDEGGVGGLAPLASSSYSPLPKLPASLLQEGAGFPAAPSSCRWRALTSMQIDGLDHVDGLLLPSGVARQLGLRTLIVSGAMRAPRQATTLARGLLPPAAGGRGQAAGESPARAAAAVPGSALATLAALTGLRRLELHPSRRCAPELRPTEAALARLAEGLTALTSLHLSLFPVEAAAGGSAGWEDQEAGGGGDEEEEEDGHANSSGIRALRRMRALRHLSLELIHRADLASSYDVPAAAATATPSTAPAVDWRRLPRALESLSLARFDALSPDDLAAAALASPNLLHLRLVGCGGGRGVPPLDAHAWRVAQGWPGLHTLVVKALPQDQQPHRHGLGSAGVAACARLSRLRALAITLEDGGGEGGGGRARSSRPLGESAPADVRPLAALAPTLEFLLLDTPRPMGGGAPPPGSRLALRALRRLRLLAMPMLALHGARADAPFSSASAVDARSTGLGVESSGAGSAGGPADAADASLAAAAAAVAAAARAAAPRDGGGAGGGGVGSGGLDALSAAEAALPRCLMVDLASAAWLAPVSGGARQWLAATSEQERDWWRRPALGEPAWEWRPTFAVLSG